MLDPIIAETMIALVQLQAWGRGGVLRQSCSREEKSTQVWPIRRHVGAAEF
jgi:hypothetical protein